MDPLALFQTDAAFPTCPEERHNCLKTHGKYNFGILQCKHSSCTPILRQSRLLQHRQIPKNHFCITRNHALSSKKLAVRLIQEPPFEAIWTDPHKVSTSLESGRTSTKWGKPLHRKPLQNLIRSLSVTTERHNAVTVQVFSSFYLWCK